MPISVLLRFNTIIPIMVIFIGAAGYGLFYFVFIKDKKLPMIFTVSPISAPWNMNLKKDELCFGYLKTFDNIYVENKKEGFGDLYFSTNKNNSESLTKEKIVELGGEMLYPDLENMPTMIFYSIENPTAVKKLALEAKESNK